MTARHDAYVQTKDLNNGMKWAGRMAVDRARQDGHNPRHGRVEIYFDDNGVGAIWREQPQPAALKCICAVFSSSGYCVADLTCPVHGVKGTQPGDWQKEQ